MNDDIEDDYEYDDENFEDFNDMEGGEEIFVVSEENMLKSLHEQNQKMAGICFALAMRQGDEIKIYTRTYQPCYGELRKYKKTHGDEATQPGGRPGDLHHPFPDGIPEALAVGLPEWHPTCGPNNGNMIAENRPFFEYLFSDRSPFLKGILSPKNVEFSLDDKGFVLKNLEIDPTVLVNLLKYLQNRVVSPYNKSTKTKFVRYLEAGMTEEEAFAADYLTNFNDQMVYKDKKYDPGLGPTDDYVFPNKTNLQKIINQNPVDLTGGTLRNRFDYSRKNLHMIFFDKNGVSMTGLIAQEIGAKWDGHRPFKISFEDFVSTFKKVYNREVQKIQKRRAA